MIAFSFNLYVYRDAAFALLPLFCAVVSEGAFNRFYEFAVDSVTREPGIASQGQYDLIIVGGGIYGAMLALEAGFRGLRSLLLERNDFGGATSYNSLRIVHGGFRYLQSCDLRRFYESVGERQWLLRAFPELVRPLPCLMPLYGKGVKRLPVLAGALLANDVLSAQRNRGVRADRHLGMGKVVGTDEVKALFPQVDAEGLKGGAVWFDASMTDSQRVVMGVLRWAGELGSCSLNYVSAEALLTENDSVAGVHGRDVVSGDTYDYHAPVVVNATGPWSVATLQQKGFEKRGLEIASTATDLFRPSLAWNVLFDRPALSDHALAIAPKQTSDGSKPQTYFLHPWKQRLLAGTIHNVWCKSADEQPAPSEEQIATFIANLNAAIPALNLQRSEVVRVFAGVLPVKQEGSTQLASREAIVSHQSRGGIQGLYSIAGVKFTTSRLVADKTLTKIFPQVKRREIARTVPINNGSFDYDWWPEKGDLGWQQPLQKMIAEEAVVHLDDLVLRRTSLGDNPARGLACGEQLSKVFEWDTTRRDAEMKRLAIALHSSH